MRRFMKQTAGVMVGLCATIPLVSHGDGLFEGSARIAEGSSMAVEGSALVVASGGQVVLGVVALPLQATGALLTDVGDASTRGGHSLWDAATSELPISDAVHVSRTEPTPADAVARREERR